jgi:hypothetical protein
VPEADTALSRPAAEGFAWLETLVELVPDIEAIPADTLAIRAHLDDNVDPERVAVELEEGGLVTRANAGLAPTGRPLEPGCVPDRQPGIRLQFP